MRHRTTASRWLTLLTAALTTTAVAAPVALTGCNEVEAGSPPEAKPLPVDAIEVVGRQDYVITQSYTGTVRSKRDSRLGFERGGLVAKVMVEQGAEVRRGQVLAQLDTRTLVAERRKLLAQRLEVEAGVGIAELTSRRLHELNQKRFASTQERDEARFQLRRSKAQREQIDAGVAAIDVQLAKSRLVAPFSGTVSSRLVDEGTVVAPGTPVVRFLDQGAPEAVVGVPIMVAANMPEGSAQRVVVGEETIEVKVTAQVRDVNPRTRTTDIVLELPEALDLRDGQVLRLLHERVIEDRGLWVPRTALTEGVRGLWSAYGLEGDAEVTTVVRHDLEVLHSDGERAYVRGTLEAGDRILRSGLHRVVPGQRVQAAEAPRFVWPAPVDASPETDSEGK